MKVKTVEALEDDDSVALEDMININVPVLKCRISGKESVLFSCCTCAINYVIIFTMQKVKLI